MSTSVTMPALGESVTEGTVTQWLKKEGDTVEVDEPLLEVSTDKVDTEVPSPVAGVVLKIVVPEDSEVEIGAELAIIGEASEADSAAPAAEPEPAAESTPAAQPDSGPAQEPLPTPEETPAQTQADAPKAAESAAAPQAAEGAEVRLPELGESVTEGTVTTWLKAIGDTVEVDEPLLEISTDKVDTEIPSPAAGTLLEIRVAEDETAEVGSVLAIVGSGTAAPAPSQAPEDKPEAEDKPQPKETPAPAESTPTRPAPAVPESTRPLEQESPAMAAKPTGSYVTPLVRKLASENDVDLSQVSGSGVGGRIRKEDVQTVIDAKKTAVPAAAPAVAAPAPAAVSPLRGRTEKLPRLRQVAAKALLESMQSMAQLTTVVEVDVTKVAKLRAAKKDEFLARHGVKLSFLPFFSIAAIEALQQFPIVNSSMNLEEKTITYPDAENVGFAVDTPKGLLVPVVKNAGDLNIPGLAKHIADLAKKAREGGLVPNDLQGGTFTITNTGSVGALFDTPIVPLGQSAILGTAVIQKRPLVINDPNLGEIVAVRSVMYLTLSYDHRLIDGADAARFLQATKKRIEEGNFEHQLGL